ncbi:MAG: cyclic nucleotide-binding domain-containing protein [Desulfobulbus sp.]|jgi:CRP-like cAMP-binding protein|uniref:cyclic nucleotide-binding domain-containing protein n=1 Tax=Desulfobulbus sp. TaxID=895 RepID=UPI00284B4E74|nr:cyclic nucleotide-binding domain-containing protein [Desulfobulbus sp.]MDR2549891.1 cyclic nucleotide-binding domain-containing protein [Desulfobulbus sp.]
MGFPKISFRVCESRHCPLFRYGDVFQISGIAICMASQDAHSFINTSMVHSPPNRGNCKILNGDLTKIIIEYERADQIPDCMISCSGCTGSIRLEHFRTAAKEDEQASTEGNVGSILRQLNDFGFFRHIDQGNLGNVIKYFKQRACKKNEIILRKGDPGDHFYVIVSGQVDILNDTGIPIATLSRGEVFGEMSLICDENVGATVQTRSDCQLLTIDHKHFKSLVGKYPALQTYFTRLLARRLADSNRVRGDDYASGMIGKLEEIPPEALFQTLNINSKTGILTITQLLKGTARFSFRQGALIKASYAGNKGETAFFDVLREKSGRFKFTPGLPPEDFDAPEIGYFMKLLMEGLQRADEERAAAATS